MTLDPIHKAELEQRKADLVRRLLALESRLNAASSASGASSIQAAIQQAQGQIQPLIVPDEDPPTGIVATLQTLEADLHQIENQLLSLNS